LAALREEVTSAAEAAGKEREACAGLEKSVAQLEAEVASLQKDWADLREDKMINLARVFGRFAALRGPLEPRERPRLEK
jgi:hypothetical protein